MYVVVAGAGQVGTEIAKNLLEEGHSVALIESDKKRLETLETLDVLALEGNAASPGKLIEAGINSADMLVAVTGSDEVNIIACIVAKSKGCRTIARISNTDYLKNGTVAAKLETFHADVAICPDTVTATQISKMLLLPSLVQSGELAKGRSMVVELRLPPGCPALTRMPGSIKLPYGAHIAAVTRFGAVLRPELAGEFKEDDRIVVVLESKDLIPEVERAFGLGVGVGKLMGDRLETGMQKFVVVGATRTGVQVAKLLEDSRVVVLIDSDEARCTEATAQLSTTLVIHGDARDPEVLTGEGVEDASAFVATTDNTEFNMLTCLLARRLGVGKTLAIVDDPELRQLFEQIGISVAVSPRMMTVNTILESITGRTQHGSVTMLQGSEVRVLEVVVTKSLWMAGRDYGAIRFPRNSFISTVIRDGKVMVPTRYDKVRLGDHIVIIAGQESIGKVERMFAHRSRLGFL
jgi:trk system potassium uptake protein TrkA